MKLHTLIISAIAVLLTCNSCFNLNDPQKITSISGIYILNNGNWGSNNANLVTYDQDKKSVSGDLFYEANRMSLGDLGQDILIYGSKMYIAVSGSGVVFVTDLKGNLLGEVKAGKDGNYQPRAISAYKDNVFISYYEGYVGRMDTVSFILNLSKKIGDNPEGIAVANDKLYAAISNGLNYPDFDSTVVVLDPSSLAIKNKVTVGVNPGKLVSCGDMVFCLCSGNYSTIPSQVNVIYKDTLTAIIKDISNPVGNCITSDGKRYVFIATDDYTNKRIVAYDCYQGAVCDTSFIKDDTKLSKSITSLDIDPINYALFVGTSDYVNNGDMYVFNQFGKLYDTFDTNGLNPMRVAFSTETTMTK